MTMEVAKAGRAVASGADQSGRAGNNASDATIG